ncbi:unnamed protein product [Lampetra planeri]
MRRYLSRGPARRAVGSRGVAGRDPEPLPGDSSTGGPAHSSLTHAARLPKKEDEEKRVSFISCFSFFASFCFSFSAARTSAANAQVVRAATKPLASPESSFPGGLRGRKPRVAIGLSRPDVAQGCYRSPPSSSPSRLN